MESEILTVLRQILELGFPGVMLIINCVLWRELNSRTKSHIEDLREVAGMRQSISVAQKIPVSYRGRDSPTLNVECDSGGT